jgi:hypothetical protein
MTALAVKHVIAYLILAALAAVALLAWWLGRRARQRRQVRHTTYDLVGEDPDSEE